MYAELQNAIMILIFYDTCYAFKVFNKLGGSGPSEYLTLVPGGLTQRSERFQRTKLLK